MLGRNAHPAAELSAEVLRVFVAALAGDFVDFYLPGGQQVPGQGKPHFDHIVDAGAAEHFFVHAVKVAFAQVDQAGHIGGRPREAGVALYFLAQVEQLILDGSFLMGLVGVQNHKQRLQ